MEVVFVPSDVANVTRVALKAAKAASVAARDIVKPDKTPTVTLRSGDDVLLTGDFAVARHLCKLGGLYAGDDVQQSAVRDAWC
jgi:hypothetical protein